MSYPSSDATLGLHRRSDPPDELVPRLAQPRGGRASSTFRGDATPVPATMTRRCAPWWAVGVCVLMCSAGVQGAATSSPAPPSSCPPEELTGYSVAMSAHWSPRDFPKHYPEWRPPAQWSKLIGEYCPVCVLPQPCPALPRASLTPHSTLSR